MEARQGARRELADGFGCEADEDSFTVYWADGRSLTARRDGTITFIKSPYQEGVPPVSTTHDNMLAASATISRRVSRASSPLPQY